MIDSGSTRRIYRFPAFANLSGEEPRPTTIMIRPVYADPSNSQRAPSTQPDVAPSDLGRREILLSSRIDPQYSVRCPRQPCENTAPLRLWVVRVPDGLTEFLPRVLTADTTYIGAGGQARWIAYQYMMPKWDPKATNPSARIAFLSDRADDPTAARSTNLWFGDLVDSNGDSRSDSLVNLRKMTTSGGIASYSWHPDGTRICLADAQGLAWMDVGSGVVTRIGLPDSLVLRPAYPTVFQRPGEHTLVAFQGQVEEPPQPVRLGRGRQHADACPAVPGTREPQPLPPLASNAQGAGLRFRLHGARVGQLLCGSRNARRTASTRRSIRTTACPERCTRPHGS